MSGPTKKWIIIIIVGALVIAGLVYFFFFRNNSESTNNIETAPTTAVEEPTPTEQPTISKADIKVKILNGSGLVGEAGRVQKILEGAGFTVESTDNADSYDHTITEIQAKQTVAASDLDELKQLLSEYTVSTSVLGESEEVDIIITLGTRKNAPTITTKPTTSVTKTPITSATPTPAATATTAPSPTPAP